jgi:HK97 family phage portal protein
MNIFDFVLDKMGMVRMSEIKNLVQKESAWSGLWKAAQENKLYGNTITRPYEQISNVYKAIKALTDNVPQADLKFYDKSGKNEITSDPIIDLFNSPNPLMTESEFVQAWVGFLALYGEVNIVRNTSIGEMTGSRKLPAELWIFNPKNFTEIISQGQLAGWRYTANLQAPGMTAQKTIFAVDEVIHTKDFNPYNLLRGIAPTSPIMQVLDIDWQTLVFNKAFFDNNATPGLMLSTEEDLTQQQINRLKEWFRQEHQGASKAFKTAILEAGLKPVNVNPTHKEMEFIEQKKFTREEILGIWRVPQAFFNVTEGLNYATFIGQMKMFWNYTVMPCLNKMTDSLNKHIVKPYNPNMICKFDLSNVVAYQEDFKEKVSTAQTLVSIGVPLNAVNEKLGLGFDDFEWGDQWWIPLSQRPAGEELLPPETPTADQPSAPDEGNKPKTALDIRKYTLWKDWVNHQAPIEARMAASLKRYFYEQRKEALESLKEYQSMAGLRWETQGKALEGLVKPYILHGLKEGVALAQALVGKDFKQDSIDARISSYLVMNTQKITRINNTIKDQISAQLAEGVKAGESIMQLADRIRDVYNMAAGRAIMIARTETAGAVNAGSYLYYEENGIRKRQWLTAHDEHVRESHRMVEGEVVEGATQRYSNGLRFPGDKEGEAVEIINCRCREIPVIE